MATQDMKCECFACNVPSLDTLRIEKVNGKTGSDFSIPESLKSLVDIETSTQQSKIIIKDNAVLEKPLQIVNIHTEDNETKTCTEIVLGKNAQATLLYCDDSLPKGESKVEHNINVVLNSYSKFSFYKLENVNNNTSIASDLTFDLFDNSMLSTYFITLNGGRLNNSILVNFVSEYAEADINGLYLMDKEQSVETQVKVFHKSNNCKSTQLFKGILDDEAKANFLGHVLVDYNAKNNIAMQTNNNILLTDKAKVNTRPVLEIYNDDVQCSHGATTGQLDENALYYLRSRGIGERTAKMLLLTAFCHSVLKKCNVESLRDGLSSMVEKRLNGDLSYDNPYKITL
ncbi:MAG: SufD family Fe-S cluster assembly protein [Bacteroidales bacterium]|nr:SufD family Fe-S cluster assembly protein [Bacteroidales bacterium]